jgi:hypothetical protein
MTHKCISGSPELSTKSEKEKKYPLNKKLQGNTYALMRVCG